MRRDPFTEVFAWVTLAFCGIGVATGSLTAVMLLWVVEDGALGLAGRHSGATLLLFRHLPMLSLLFLLYSACGLAASVGLLRGDRLWARKLWIVLLALGIGWEMFIMAVEIFAPDPFEPAPAVGSLFPPTSTIALFAVIPVGIGMVAASSWLIHRLYRGLPTSRAGDPRG
jgi:hypothetical protein